MYGRLWRLTTRWRLSWASITGSWLGGSGWCKSVGGPLRVTHRGHGEASGSSYTFARVVPFGDFHKKDSAMEIIRRETSDNIIRRRMLQLLVLLPEKKSLYLAQKAMDCRNDEKVMEAFRCSVQY